MEKSLWSACSFTEEDITTENTRLLALLLKNQINLKA